jgi:hypothetical protein
MQNAKCRIQKRSVFFRILHCAFCIAGCRRLFSNLPGTLDTGRHSAARYARPDARGRVPQLEVDMKNAGYALLAVVLLCGAGVPVTAHHSFAAHYDMKSPITIEGTLVQVRLTNPHSWFYLDVKDAKGTVTRWAFEAGTPSGMIRNGYKASELPPGTTVTIRGFPARESPNVGMLQQLTTADGRTYGMFGPQEGAGR